MLKSRARADAGVDANSSANRQQGVGFTGLYPDVFPARHRQFERPDESGFGHLKGVFISFGLFETLGFVLRVRGSEVQLDVSEMEEGTLDRLHRIRNLQHGLMVRGWSYSSGVRVLGWSFDEASGRCPWTRKDGGSKSGRHRALSSSSTAS